MKSGWVVTWPGRTCRVYLAGFEDGVHWSLDPSEAKVFHYWAQAKAAQVFTLKQDVQVSRCWYDNECAVDAEERV